MHCNVKLVVTTAKMEALFAAAENEATTNFVMINMMVNSKLLADLNKVVCEGCEHIGAKRGFKLGTYARVTDGWRW